jgi:hypothetical protein
MGYPRRSPVFAPDLGGPHRLTVTRPAALEQARVRKLADAHRLEPGVTHRFFGHP